ncbi:MAG: thymidine phosphorylase [Nanoarchaeota archaeon]
MKLKSKFLRWNAGLPMAMLNKETAMEIGVKARETILIRTISKHPKEVTAALDIIDGQFGRKQVLLSLEIKSKLNLREGEIVDINIAPIPRSVDLIKKKLNNNRLSREEIEEIIKDIVNDRLSEPEIALFVAAMYRNGMSNKETIYLINAILKTGERFSVRNKFVVDKHSIGGVAGNRTTPIVVSICAAAGLIFPKTSSRAITSAAGTADVMETIVKVGFTISELKQILKKTKAFIVWGGGMGTVPADSKIIKIERELKIDPKSQLLASIMSKKFSVGSKYILIDIPYGKTAKIPTREKAKSLARRFLQLGRYFHKKMRVVLTDGSQPIGNGVGPALELMDIIKILDPKQRGPKDLEKKALFLAGNIFEMTGKAKKGKGIEMAERILYSGKAFKKFKEIVKAQHGNLNRIKYAKLKKDILSDRAGEIIEIDNKRINLLARAAGSPVDKPAGIYLYYHLWDRIKKGEKIITIYSETKPRINEALRFFRENPPIRIR